MLLRARRVKQLVTVRKVECRPLNRTYRCVRLRVYVCVSVNNAVRCTLLVLNTI